jgi:hypothetical protein
MLSPVRLDNAIMSASTIRARRHAHLALEGFAE